MASEDTTVRRCELSDPVELDQVQKYLEPHGMSRSILIERTGRNP